MNKRERIKAIKAAAAELPDGTRIFRMELGKCAYCDSTRSETLIPPHQASENCESGKHDHCTCDVCF